VTLERKSSQEKEQEKPRKGKRTAKRRRKISHEQKEEQPRGGERTATRRR
jgi:hypothetical protein